MAVQSKKMPIEGKKPAINMSIIVRIALSLLFALILWGYVMTTINPERSREVDGIAVTTVGDSDLLTRQLVVKGNVSSILGTVTVRVQTDVNHFFDVTADKITARVNIGDIMEAGSVTLRINAETSVGRIESITPSTVTLEVDNLETKSVPIEPSYTGALPDGYYCSSTSLESNTISLTGPKSTIDSIVKAVCTIPLEDKTESFTRTYGLELYDEDDNVVETTGFTSAFTPTVTVSMEILKTLTVPIEVLTAGTLTDAYEVTETSVQPSSVVVAGSDEALENLTSLKTNFIDITGLEDDYITTSRVNLRTLGVTLISNASLSEITVSINIKIDEKVITHASADEPIEIINLPAGVDDVTLSRETVDVTYTMSYSLLMALETNEILLNWYINAPQIPISYISGPLQASLMFELSLSENSDMIVSQRYTNTDGDYVIVFQMYNSSGAIIEKTMTISWDRTPIDVVYSVQAAVN